MKTTADLMISLKLEVTIVGRKQESTTEKPSLPSYSIKDENRFYNERKQ